MNDKKKRVLVTGGSGLVGKAIEEVVNQKSLDFVNLEFIFLSSKNADLSNYNESKVIFEKYQPNYVIHLAAMVGGLFKNMANNLQFFRVNMKINDNVLFLAHQFKVEKCISCLSTCIFPDKTSYPIDEKMVHLGPPHNSNFGYSYAKRMIDVLNQGYSDFYDKNSLISNKPVFTSVIPTNVYGPFDNFNLQDSHVIPGLVHKAYLKAKEASDHGLKEATLTVGGSGKPMRQFIYSLDLAKLILWVTFNYNETEPIILSVDEKEEISIGQVASLISNAFFKQLGVKLSIQNDLALPDGQFKKTANNFKLRSYLPNFRFTPITEGIETTVDWFCKNFENARK